MICSIIFNDQRVSAFLFREVKKTFVLEKELEFEEDVSGEDLVNDQELLKNFLYKYFHGYKEAKFNVLVDGMDIQYLTVPYSGVDLSEDMDNRRIEDTILTAAKINLPKDLSQLHSNYTTCVMKAEQNDLGYLFSLAFFPTDYLFNLKICFGECGLNLMNISPLPYGIFNGLNKKGKLLVTGSGKSISAFCNSGIYVWSVPEGCQIYEDELIEQIVADARKALNADDLECEEVNANNVADFLRPGLTVDGDLGMDTVYAFGQLLPVPKTENTAEEETAETENPEENYEEEEYDEDGNPIVKRKGVLANVTGKLRELLHFGRGQDGEV